MERKGKRVASGATDFLRWFWHKACIKQQKQGETYCTKKEKMRTRQHWLLISSKPGYNQCVTALRLSGPEMGHHLSQWLWKMGHYDHVMFSQVEEAESLHKSPAMGPLTLPSPPPPILSPQWVTHRNVHIVAGPSSLDLSEYSLNTMYQVLLEIIKNRFCLRNSSGMEIVIPVAWKENNTLLDTNKEKLG